MKICVVGAGAIGGMLGVRLAQAGAQVSFIARGANLQALRERGMKLIWEDGSEHVTQPVRATQNLAEAGEQDIVILGMKAHQVAAIAPQLRQVLKSDTMIVTTQNGIPWWYFYKQPGPYQGTRIEAVDPGGVIAANIDIERVVGCVVYPAAELAAPGVIRHIEGTRFSVGEIDGAETERVKTLSEWLRNAGFKAPVLKDIRSEIWLKLWGNLSFNPISALTHATLADICQFAATRELAARMMGEAQTIGEKLGVQFKVSLEKRIAGAEAVGKHKTSMLQDVEQGRALELEALVGAVVELGRITGTPTPTIETVHALTALLRKTLQDEHGRLRIEKLPT